MERRLRLAVPAPLLHQGHIRRLERAVQSETACSRCHQRPLASGLVYRLSCETSRTAPRAALVVIMAYA